jgi:hypothetical protein
VTLIVFGGISNAEDYELMKETFLYTIDLQDLAESKIELLKVKAVGGS